MFIHKASTFFFNTKLPATVLNHILDFTFLLYLEQQSLTNHVNIYLFILNVYTIIIIGALTAMSVILG